jgi:hypothetical protein
MRIIGTSALGLSCVLAVTGIACGTGDTAVSARPVTTTGPTTTTPAPPATQSDDPAALVEPLARVMEEHGDLRDVVAADGLTLDYNRAVEHFTPEQLEGILRDPTVRKWAGGACGFDCEEGTFAEIVADSLLGAFRDPDVVLGMNEAVTDSATPLGEFPPDLAGLDFVGVHDPGDNPEFGGVDWTTWLVFFEEHQGRQVVAGLRYYTWQP